MMRKWLLPLILLGLIPSMLFAMGSADTASSDWHAQFITALTNPNVVYILLLVGMYGLIFEILNPGTILPGAAGIIALFLVLYALQLMPINFIGLALISVGIILMMIEIYIFTFGVLGISGVITFIVGSAILFDVHDPRYQLAWPLIIIMSAITIAFFLMIANLVIKAHKRKVVTGKEGLIGKEGIVISVANQQLIVRVEGELWEARATTAIGVDARVRVTGIHGLILIVTLIPD
jgi:membrane-bound serine protease (ClpP class)